MLANLPKLENLDFIRDISPDDWMMPKDRSPDWYYQRGYMGLEILAEECARARLHPSAILDFGCGHGCVARMLKAFYPGSQIVGMDVNPGWLNWCRDVLKIETALSAKTILALSLDEERYDLIWAGSVFSHISEKTAIHLLKEFKKALRPKGIAVFSTAGQVMRNGYGPGKIAHLDESDILQMMAAFDDGGYGYADKNTDTYKEWGHSIVPYQWYLEQSISLGMPMCGFLEGGWARIQDIYTVRKEKTAAKWPA